MFKKILVPTDFSQPADSLLSCIDRISGLGATEVVLLHVTDTRDAVSFLGFDSDFYKRHDSLAEKELVQRCREVEKQGYRCRTTMIHDIPGKGIVATATEEGCDMIVMASHGKGLMARHLLGGCAAYVVEHAPMPVLLFRGEFPDSRDWVCRQLGGALLDHVLFATDFSDYANKAFEVLKSVAPETGAVTLFHVNAHRPCDHRTPEREPEKFFEEDMQRMHDLSEDLRSAGCPKVKIQIREGCVKDAIITKTNQEDMTLLVMGTRGWGLFRGLLIGSIARTAAEYAKIPVLLVRN